MELAPDLSRPLPKKILGPAGWASTPRVKGFIWVQRGTALSSALDIW